MATKPQKIAVRCTQVGLILCLPVGLFARSQQKPPDFQNDVLPIFRAHCSKCHTGDSPDGGLSLETSAAILKGGDSGKSAIAGNSSTSILLDRIEGKGGKPRMPMGFAPLSQAQIKTVKDWIDAGCPEGAIRKQHWAYVPPIKPPVPVIKSQWIRNEIDGFVYETLAKNQLKASTEADRTTLIRRLTIDLVGLPPTPAEVDAFNADRSNNAYEKVVNRLLANPHFGEKMALPWLDAARYADSNGFQMDGDTYQYVWRDWVIRAFNSNMPFDQFTIKQLAGDLLPNPTQDDLVATAFNRNHMLNGEGGAIPEEQRNVGLFDRVDTTSTTWLGLTMTCDRCHDHKYDPFKQTDYFSMMAFFNQVPESGVPTDNDGKHYIARPWIYSGSTDEMAKMKSLTEQLDNAKKAAKPYEEDRESQSKLEKAAPKTGNKEIDDILAIEPTKRNKDQTSKLNTYYLDNALVEPGKSLRKSWKDLEKQLNDLKTTIPRVMVMSDAQPRKTYVYGRGDYTSPLNEVQPNTPESLPKLNHPLKSRLDLAEWVTSPQNPLTARVAVNRFWQMFFGKGLVRTPENFGVQGESPTHPALLDWLAVDFREHGWNMKRLVRQIVMSATYRQSSRVSRELYSKDPDNRLLARGPRFRMSSLLIRDEALAASGLLNSKMFGKPVYPYQPKGIWDGLNITDERDFSYPQSKGDDLYRRSIYTFWRRTVAPGDMFDTSSRQICTVRSYQTSTPLHALTTLNAITWIEASRVLAEKVMKEIPSPEGRLREAFRRVCARRPSADELAILLRSLNRSRKAFSNDPKQAHDFLDQGESPRDTHLDPIERAAYSSVCLAIFNLDEALTKE